MSDTKPILRERLTILEAEIERLRAMLCPTCQKVTNDLCSDGWHRKIDGTKEIERLRADNKRLIADTGLGDMLENMQSEIERLRASHAGLLAVMSDWQRDAVIAKAKLEATNAALCAALKAYEELDGADE